MLCRDAGPSHRTMPNACHRGLVDQVRDDNSRTQLREVTRAYEAAAFRAAIISIGLPWRSTS